MNEATYRDLRQLLWHRHRLGDNHRPHRDLRHKPLLERKRVLSKLVPKDHPRLLYMSHVNSDGTHFFELVCEQNLEGIVCKPKMSPYPFTWIKVKNPNYTQADRGEWFGHENKGPTSSTV